MTMKNVSEKLAAASLGLLSLLCSCSGGARPETVDDTDSLYRGSMALLDLYTDSIGHAPDSASAAGAFGRFQEKFDSLNFAVAPNTDLQLTEEENDTLYARLIRIREIFEEKLYNLGHPLAPDPEEMIDEAEEMTVPPQQ